jgi:hypothetical protein
LQFNAIHPANTLKSVPAREYIFQQRGDRFSELCRWAQNRSASGPKAQVPMLLLQLILSFVGCVFSANVGLNYSMVLVGGGLYDNNTAVWNTIVQLGGGKGVARFGVVSAASEARWLLVWSLSSLAFRNLVTLLLL